ncbi:BTAD domain-containing putative transcriptional regulator [Microbacter sp. GSS18]|nr:BTAD domain-containing putative transcriptional regulator [Microbacter sp. GSS18]
MAIDVLGPVNVGAVSLHPRERSVLAALVVRDGNPIAAEDLAEAIWADAERPATWNKQIQQAVALLRKALGADRIVTTPAGYHLDVDPDEIDAKRFEDLVVLAREHHVEGEPGRAVDGYRRALALWRGTPFDELSSWPEAAAAASDLAQLRIEAAEGLLRARLDVGDAVGVVPEAERLVRDEPLRESRWALLALALYRAGRQADALAVLRSARERLADELGVDASKEITDLETAILQHDDALDDTLSVTQTRVDCPYRGLGTYEESDAGDFFGRDDEIAAAARRLDDAGFLVVTGASGSGKSSLVRAGLVPSLRRRGRRILVVGPGPALVETLRDAMGPRMRTDVVVVDQFEEVLESGDAIGGEVARLLADFVDEGGKAIITVRSDFLDRTAADPSLGPLVSESVVVVSPMSEDDLRRVIEEPAARAGLKLESGLVELMLRDAADSPGVLPHLSHALAETWVRREGPVLTVAGYEATGGIGGAIAQSADRLFTALDADDQELCRSTLLRLVALAPDGLPVRRRITAAPLREDASRARLFDQLTQARLVSVEGDSVALAHESLTRAWPRFRGWVREGAEDLTVLGNIQSGAETWDADGRAVEDLARGARLQAMVELRERIDPNLTSIEGEFVDASAAHEQDEKRALEESAAAERRQNRRLRWAVAGIAAMLVVALTAGTLALRSASSEAQAAESARIDALASASAALRGENRTLAALLAAEAYRRWPDDARARGMLLSLLGSAAGTTERMYWPGAGVRIGAAALPGTETALVVMGEHPQIRDLSTGALIREFEEEIPAGDSQRRPHVQLSDDGSIATIVTDREFPGDGDNWGSVLTVMDVADGTMIGEPIVIEQSIFGYALSPSGRYVAAVSDTTGDLIVVDTPDGSVRTVAGFAGEPPFAYRQLGTVAFHPDDTMLVGSYHGEHTTVDPVTLDVRSRVPVPEDRANTTMRVLDDGRVFSAGHSGFMLVSRDGTILWDQEADLGRPCSFMTVALERDLLYCGGRDNVIEERSLATGESTGRSVNTEVEATGELYLVGADTVLNIGVGSSVGRWHLGAIPNITQLIAEDTAILEGFDPSGRYLLMGPQSYDFLNEPAEYSVWDAETGRIALNISTLLPYWVGNGLIRTFDPGGKNRYIDVETGDEWAAPVQDFEKYPDDPWVWSEPRPSRDGTIIYEMDCCTGAIEALDARTGEKLGIQFALNDAGRSAKTTADGSKLIATALDFNSGNWQIAVFDAKTGEKLAEANGADYEALAVTADDRIITGSEQSLLISSLELAPISVLPAPIGSATALDLSDDDALLLLTTSEPRVALYDLDAGHMMGDALTADPGMTPRVAALHPSGDFMLVNSSAGVTRWNLDPGPWYEQACRVAGRNLTEVEWDTYLSEVGTWRETCEFATE